MKSATSETPLGNCSSGITSHVHARSRVRFAASWFATWCWVIASRRLSLALSAQLIVAETVFGLAYGFMFEERLPTMAEGIGSIIQLAGVSAAIAEFTKLAKLPEVPQYS